MRSLSQGNSHLRNQTVKGIFLFFFATTHPFPFLLFVVVFSMLNSFEVTLFP